MITGNPAKLTIFMGWIYVHRAHKLLLMKRAIYPRLSTHLTKAWVRVLPILAPAAWLRQGLLQLGLQREWIPKANAL